LRQAGLAPVLGEGDGPVSRIAVFGYGSLANLASLEDTLARPVEPAGLGRLRGWRRRWSLARDNLACEKTFARAGDGSLPAFCLGLNVERAAPGRSTPDDGPNGVLIQVSEGELGRLGLREMRYDRVDVTEEIASEAAPGATTPPELDRVFTYTAKREHYSHTPPPGAVILAHYALAVEAAFAALGDEELEVYRETTEPHPVEIVEGVLVRDEIPAGNPREW
jgi:hypothetical protein